MPRKPVTVPAIQEALIHACMDGDVARVEQALASGAQLDYEAEDSGGIQRPLVLAATRGHVGLFRFLVARGADLARRTPSGETVLLEAAKHDQAEIVAICLELDPSTALKNEALRCAVGSGSARTVRVLLDRGADPNARSETGRTAVHATAQMRPASYTSGDAARIVRALVDSGGDLHAATDDGDTVVHLACNSDFVSDAWLDQLRELGARIDDANAWGMTPLWTAARTNRTERVFWLLSRGADPNAKTTRDSAIAKAGVSVYEIARPRADLKLLAALRDAGAVVPASMRAAPPVVDPLRVGARVSHPKFGTGEIVAREGAGEQLKLTIAFADGKKVLLAKFVSPSA